MATVADPMAAATAQAGVAESSTEVLARDARVVLARSRLADDLAAAARREAAAAQLEQALTNYRIALSQAVVKRYPSRAVERGLTGQAQVRLAQFGGGAPAQVSLTVSSGHALLDDEAKAMILRAAARARLPEPLQGRPFSVELPVSFDLN